MKKIKKITILLVIMVMCFSVKSLAEEVKSIFEVKPGDFVDYTAGVWTEEEINDLKNKNLYSDFPVTYTEGFQAFQFKGINVGTSKDKSIIDENKYPTGWRILSNSNNSIKIISSGITEQYGSPFDYNFAYFTFYIINGFKHPDDNTNIVEEENPNAVRNWSVYENKDYAIPGTAHLITYKESLGITGSLSNTNNDLRTIGMNYLLADLHCNQDMWTVETGGKMDRWGDRILGIRPVVNLNNDLQVEKTGEYNGYNVWKLINNSGENNINQSSTVEETYENRLSDIEKLLNESRSKLTENQEENNTQDLQEVNEEKLNKNDSTPLETSQNTDDEISNNNYRLILLIIIVIIIILILTFIIVLIIFNKSKKNDENNE